MFLNSTNASNFFNYLYFDYIFFNKNEKELKERSFQFAYSYINNLNRNLFGIEFIKKINKYFVFKDEQIIKINEDFFIDNKEEFINLLHPTWYKLNLNKINHNKKDLLTLFIFSKIMKIELQDFFYSIFLSKDNIKIFEIDKFSGDFEVGYLKNKFRLPAKYFLKNKLKLTRDSFSLLKKTKIDIETFENHKKEIIMFLEELLVVSYDILYNRQKTKLTKEIEEELIFYKIISSEENIYYDKKISLNSSLKFKLTIHPKKFITYDFKNKELINMKQELMEIINVIDLIKEIKIES